MSLFCPLIRLPAAHPLHSKRCCGCIPPPNSISSSRAPGGSRTWAPSCKPCGCLTSCKPPPHPLCFGLSSPGYTAGTPYKVPPTQSNNAPPPYSPSPNPYQTAMYPIRSAYPQQNLYTQVRASLCIFHHHLIPPLGSFPPQIPHLDVGARCQCHT